jgi:hypothetical protein
MKASQLARPIVNAGNRMWQEMTKPNWIRDKSSGDNNRPSTNASPAARGERRAA